MKYWLIKSEEDCYSIDTLRKDMVTPWSGVRNFQARNFMRDDMKIGDKALFYYSNSKLTGVVGVAEVCSLPYPDPTAFDVRNEHFDPKSKREKPTWILVDFKFLKKFKRPLSLSEIKSDKNLEGMPVTLKGNRLSIQPVSEKHFKYIVTRCE